MSEKEYHIDYLFTYPKKFRPTSWLIKTVLGTKYSHVVTVVNTGPIETYDVYQASHGDCNLVELENFLAKNHVIKSRSIKLTRDEYIRTIRFLKLQCGKKYSYIGAIASAFKPFRRLGLGNDGDKTFICSEYALRGLEEGLNRNIQRNDDWVEPKLFEQLLDDLT